MPQKVFASLDRVGLFARTVRHLRVEQVWYLLYRRFIPNSRPHRRYDAARVRDGLPALAGIASGDPTGSGDEFCFVGRAKSIADGIDWRSPQMSRLWRYHLHYFDYLRDDVRSPEWKRASIVDWIASNPIATTDAWEPYPVSLRIVNWIKFFTAETRAGLTVPPQHLESLYRQALWLEANLERHVLANHFLKNAKALVFAGSFFEGIDADRWRRVGLRILQSEIEEQFLGDGGHYERSPMYHIICTEDLLDILSFVEREVPPISSEFLRRLHSRARAALDYLDAIVMPDGDIPLFNDAAFELAPRPQELFAYAHRLFGYEPSSKAAAPSARAFSKSGYFVIRGHNDALVIDCGTMGPAYQPGHAHCDTLSYELAIAGERVVTDTGVYDYQAGPQRRYARSTAAHNTVAIDGREQSEVWGAFRVGRRARPLVAELRMDPSGAIHFCGTHDGFARGTNRLIHSRSLTYENRRWLVCDSIQGTGIHLVENRIHLSPHLRASLQNGKVFVTNSDGKVRAKITFESTLALDVRIETSHYYPKFAMAIERSVIVLSSRGKLPVEMQYTIAPAST